MALELRHHLLAEQLQRLADVLVGVLAGLVEQDDLVDVGGLELGELLAERVRRADQAAPERGLLGGGVGRFQALYSSHMLTVPGAGRLRSLEAP